MPNDRIQSSAEEAVREDVGTEEGQGTATAGAHGDHLTGGAAGEAGKQSVPGHGERGAVPDADAEDTPDTEGGRYLEETHDIAESRMQRPAPDLSGDEGEDVPDDYPLGQGKDDDEAASRADIPNEALGAGSIDPSNTSRSGTPGTSDRAHPLG